MKHKHIKLIAKVIFNYVLPLSTAYAIYYGSDFNMVKRIAIAVLCLTAFQAKYDINRDFPDD